MGNSSSLDTIQQSRSIMLNSQQKLQYLYLQKLLPLERFSNFDKFYNLPIPDSEFVAKPHVLLLGQYSTGKTTLINYLLGTDYYGCQVGPEPTTDKFVAIMEGSEERVIPGGALSVHPTLPYHGLEKFGLAFLNKFIGVQSISPILHSVSFVDSPGILSGEKQSLARGYNFVEVSSWFAEQADMIIVLFDADKLDISDDLRDVILGLLPNREKIRFVLNKADQLDKQNLLRVHGSLLWSLGKIITTPEVPRVYVGSFWKDKNIHCENLDLLQREEKDLIEELYHLPSNNLIRKINLVARRCRQVRVHALIISYLKDHSSSFSFRPEAQQHEMIDHLENIFKEILRSHPELVSLADFPEILHFQQQLLKADWSTFHSLKHHEELLNHVNELLTTDLSNLIHEVRYSNIQETPHQEIQEDHQQNKLETNSSSLIENKSQEITTPAKRRGKFHGIMRPNENKTLSSNNGKEL